MLKIFRIILLTCSLFIAEFIVADFSGGWFRPNLLILLVIFFNAHRGIRYSLLVAFIAGFLKDSYGAGVFGANIFAFALCAYATTLIQKYFYHLESFFLRLVVVLSVTFLYTSVLYVFYSSSAPLSFQEVVIFVMLPEVLSTILVASLFLKGLDACVLKLSV